MLISILAPAGWLPLEISEKYTLRQILNLDETTLLTFLKLLQLPTTGTRRYYLIYTLALNSLLDYHVHWVKSFREKLISLDSVIAHKGTVEELFNLLSVKTSCDFEQSFHLQPQFFECPESETLRSQIVSTITPGFKLDVATVQRTFNLIDKEFCRGLLKTRLTASGKKIEFRVSPKMTRTAGSFTSGESYILTISSRVNEVIGEKLNSGVICVGPVDAFVVTMQHEITHPELRSFSGRRSRRLIVHLEKERRACPDSDEFKSHGRLFQKIAGSLFGLSERTHSLFEEGDPMQSVCSGDSVSFNFKGTLLSGTIVKLNPKRAKVMTLDGKVYTVPYALVLSSK